MKRRNTIARDLKTPKYRSRIVANRKRKANKLACRKKPKAYASRIRFTGSITL